MSLPAFIRVALAVFTLFCNNSLAEEPDLFKESVVPILQSRCVSCHNAIDRKGELSLQTQQEVLSSGYIEPGRPEDSELLRAIVAHNGRQPTMPKSGEPLNATEVAVIQAWITDGAKWPDGFSIKQPVVDNLDWWSFKPMVNPMARPIIRPDQNSGIQQQVSNPIDLLIHKALSEQKLTPSKPAEPRVLVRRLYYDLIGLPPTPEEVDAFVRESAQDSPGTQPTTYERLVDRLLASPRYGERWARHWLDVVKYADTCGYDKDKLRPNAWPYRDYVIKSFNDDKPYTRFVQEQLAGDVLFPGTADGILGLGFIAAGPWDFIGHAEVPESKIDGKVARHTDRDEMVSNTLNTFCSVTIQCCQCHNHKFDPFTQEHYYNLQSVFAAVDRAERAYDLDPEVEKQRRRLTDQLNAAREELKALNEAIQKDGGAELVDIEKRIAELQPLATPVAKQPEFGYHSNTSTQQDVDRWVQIDLGSEVEISKIVLRPCHDDFNNIGAGFGFPVQFKISAGMPTNEATDPEKEPATLLHDATGSDVPNPGLAAYEIAVANTQARFIRLTATKLAPRSNDYMLALAEVQIFDSTGNNVALMAQVTALDSIEAPDRWRMSNLTDGIWAKVGDEAAASQLAEAVKRRQAILDRITTSERTAERERLSKQIVSCESQLTSLPSGRMVYAAATHFPPNGTFQPTNGKPREIQLLHRGNVSQPLQPSLPGTLPLCSDSDSMIDQSGHFVLQPDHTEGDRRAALARWITQPEHPLTWRSIVNRVWQHHFGRGLVETPNDFGRMGKPPSHPELLDWLALEFRDNGQSLKHLHKLIVMSMTYQQSSAHDDSNSEIDSDNHFLWRMNRRRLDAEEIRDSMLAASGKLDLKMGGPGYYLFVLERPEHSPHYEYHKFDPNESASHRRSIYRFIVRSQPDPYMTTLDCADSSQSTPQRNETLTSLQALSLLNNSFSLAISQHFANKLSSERTSTADQVMRGFQLVSGRSATEEELVELTAYAEEHGLANLCRVLFNLSEFVYVD